MGTFTDGRECTECPKGATAPLNANQCIGKVIDHAICRLQAQ